MKNQGWIALHRQIQEHWLWNEKPFSRGQAWIDLLMMANHSDNKFLLGNELVEVKTGSFITSELKLAERWGWSTTKVRAFLQLLQNDKMIVKEADRKKSTITIVKYSDYSVLESTEKVQKKYKKSTEKVQKNTNNNDNNDNNDNNVYKSYSDDLALNTALAAFVEHRKKLKKPMTDYAVELMLKKLNKLSDSVPEQIEIINHAIERGWLGIFPMQKDKEQPKRTGETKNNYNDFMAQLAAMRE